MPCEGGVQPLSRAEAQALMKQLKSEWQPRRRRGRASRSEWKFRNFSPHDELRQRRGAHRQRRGPPSAPVLGYGYCRIRYNTHAIGGLSESYPICAAKIDALPRAAIRAGRDHARATAASTWLSAIPVFCSMSSWSARDPGARSPASREVPVPLPTPPNSHAIGI